MANGTLDSIELLHDLADLPQGGGALPHRPRSRTVESNAGRFAGYYRVGTCLEVVQSPKNQLTYVKYPVAGRIG